EGLSAPLANGGGEVPPTCLKPRSRSWTEQQQARWRHMTRDLSGSGGGSSGGSSGDCWYSLDGHSASSSAGGYCCDGPSGSCGGGGHARLVDRSVTALVYDGSGSRLFAASCGAVAGWALRQLEQPERVPTLHPPTCLLIAPEDYGHRSGSGGGSCTRSSSSSGSPVRGSSGCGCMLSADPATHASCSSSRSTSTAVDGAGSNKNRVAANTKHTTIAYAVDNASGGMRDANPNNPAAAVGAIDTSTGFASCRPRRHFRRSSAAPHPPTVSSLAISHSGTHLAFALADGAVHLTMYATSAATATAVAVAAAAASIGSGALPGGCHLVPRAACVRLLPPGPQPSLQAAGHTQPGTATQLAFTRDERRLMVLGLGLRPGVESDVEVGDGRRQRRSPVASRLAEVEAVEEEGGCTGGGGERHVSGASGGTRGVLEVEAEAAVGGVVRYVLHCFPLTGEEGAG
ncbi:hypothetical protein Agub_g2562, partial [Astrephomene gubernaculifera]